MAVIKYGHVIRRITLKRTYRQIVTASRASWRAAEIEINAAAELEGWCTLIKTASFTNPVVHVSALTISDSQMSLIPSERIIN